jgi:hypothetical protein
MLDVHGYGVHIGNTLGEEGKSGIGKTIPHRGIYNSFRDKGLSKFRTMADPSSDEWRELGMGA